jgi:histidinol dehydrogenase
MNVARLQTDHADFETQLQALLKWDMRSDEGVERVARDILHAVRDEGDPAVLRFTNKFDGLAATEMAELSLGPDELQAAWQRLGPTDQAALTKAAARVHSYHEHQIEHSWSYTDDLGNELGQKIAPLERVGVYVPGGQASYPSSVLMTLIPARVAGVEELIVTVPTPNGVRNDMVLAALSVAGADQVFTVGGAQAIAAMAYGTDSIPRVDKIVGPGNAYVAAAKRQVFGHVGIDIIAGPSEVLVLADGTTDPEWVALDLFSQAEHDAAAQSILLSPDARFVAEVDAEMQRLLPTMRRRDIIAASLAARGALVITRDMDEAVAIANRIAPEHLELHVADPGAWVEQIRHAGAIFCGPYSAETFGDYVAGPSHVLPTFGTARFASPLGVYDFQKRSSVIRMSREGAADLADIAVPLATSEGLEAHARAAAARAAVTNTEETE